MAKWGEWVDHAVLRVLPKDQRGDGDRVALDEPLRYIDHDGLLHTVPAGFAFDGASIPRFAWSLIGGPLDGNYVRSAALHDYGCVVRTETSRVVHDRFYRTMRAEGVRWLQAQLMHKAVRLFGPRWTNANE